MPTKEPHVVCKTFTAGQAKKASGLSYAQIVRMEKAGVVVPSVRVANGPDTCRVYSFTDLVALRVAAELRSAGISMRDLCKIVDYLKSLNYENALADPYLVVAHGKDVLLVKEDALVSTLRSPGQLYFVFDLNDAVENLKTIAVKFERADRGKARVAVA